MVFLSSKNDLCCDVSLQVATDYTVYTGIFFQSMVDRQVIEVCTTGVKQYQDKWSVRYCHHVAESGTKYLFGQL